MCKIRPRVQELFNSRNAKRTLPYTLLVTKKSPLKDPKMKKARKKTNSKVEKGVPILQKNYRAKQNFALSIP